MKDDIRLVHFLGAKNGTDIWINPEHVTGLVALQTIGEVRIMVDAPHHYDVRVTMPEALKSLTTAGAQPQGGLPTLDVDGNA